MNKTVSIRNHLGLGLILLFAAVYLLPLNIRQLSVPDEMRYGEIAREMLASGDFITPRLNGLRYFEKPAGGHVLNAAAMALFGETNFAVRLMSALATGFGSVALFRLMKREYETQTAAVGAFVFLTCAEVMSLGTFSVLDGMVSGLITLSLCCLYPALNAKGGVRVGLLVLTGLFAGSAFLVKGFIALAIPVIVIVPYLLIRRQWRSLFTLPWIPLAAALAVSLPWSLAIAAKEPDFWHYFFWEEHIRRFISKGQAQHEAPFWYFVPFFIAGTLPWILIALRPLRDLLKRRRSEPLIQFALCWLIAPFLFFSASSGKLPTYILPCFTPFALLLARALTDRFDLHPADRALRTGTFIFSIMLGLALIALLVIGGLDVFGFLPPLDSHFALKFTGALIGLSTALLLVLGTGRTNDSLRKTVMLGLSAATLFVTAQGCAPSEISTNLGIQKFLESHQHRIDPNTILIGDPKTVHALCYVYKRTDAYLFRRKGELEYGLSYPDSAHRYLGIPTLYTLLSQRGNRRVIIVIKDSQTNSIRSQLPQPAYQQRWLNLWLAAYEPKTEQTKE